jgi:hypothetical protein
MLVAAVVALQMAVQVVLAAAVLVDLIQLMLFPVLQTLAAVVVVLEQQHIKLAQAAQA